MKSNIKDITKAQNELNAEKDHNNNNKIQIILMIMIIMIKNLIIKIYSRIIMLHLKILGFSKFDNLKKKKDNNCLLSENQINEKKIEKNNKKPLTQSKIIKNYSNYSENIRNNIINNRKEYNSYNLNNCLINNLTNKKKINYVKSQKKEI